MRQSFEVNPACIKCLASIQSNLTNHGIDVSHIEEFIKECTEYEKKRIENASCFEERMDRKLRLFEVQRFLGLIQRTKTHT
jgi:hypothetical protein